MNRLSVYPITLNEESKLPCALRSLGGIADETVVVDCGSQDRTQELARTFGAKVVVREWTNSAEQKNFAAVPRMAHFANGGARRVAEIQEI